MSLWTSSFHMEIVDRTPDEVLDTLRQVGVWHLRGLRVRVRGNRIRARRVEGPDSPLLKVVVEAAGPHTRLVGEMHWAATHADLVIRCIAPAVLGLGIAIWGIVDAAWQAIAIGGALALFMGGVSVAVARLSWQNRDFELSLMREALAVAVEPGRLW